MQHLRWRFADTDRESSQEIKMSAFAIEDAHFFSYVYRACGNYLSTEKR